MTDHESIAEAKRQLSQAICKSECLNNKGLAKIYENKSEWLSRLVYLAEKQAKGEEKNDR